MLQLLQALHFFPEWSRLLWGVRAGSGRTRVKLLTVSGSRFGSQAHHPEVGEDVRVDESGRGGAGAGLVCIL